MEWVVWWACLAVMLFGMAGCLLPVVPGTPLIFLAALGHRLVAGPGNGLSWWALGGLGALLVVSYLVDLGAGVVGAKYFGASRWGMVGGVVGIVVGFFFGLPGIILGPIAGVVAGELLRGRGWLPAGKSSAGAVIGTIAASIAKVLIAAAMTAWFVIGTLGSR